MLFRSIETTQSELLAIDSETGSSYDQDAAIAKATEVSKQLESVKTAHNSLENSFKIVENKAKWHKKMAVALCCVLVSGLLLYLYDLNKRQHQVTWNMVTTWDGNGSYISDKLQKLVREVDSTTEGGFKILIFNNLQMPNTGKSCTLKEVGKALENDNAPFQMLHSSKYYYQWQDEKPAAIFFSAIPFGMNYEQANTWLGENLLEGKPTEGYRLWQKTFNSGNTISFPCGHTGPQWGGWYKKEMTSIDSFRGKNIRIAGFGGLVLQNLGAKTTFIPQYQILPAMYSDTFDMVEWINPVDDYKTGMHKTGHYKFVDVSEWSEPNSVFCMTMNKAAYENLPNDYKKALVKAIEKMNLTMVQMNLGEETKKCIELIQKEGHISYFKLKPEIQDSLKRLTSRLLYEHVQNNKDKHPEILDVYNSFLNHSDGALRFKTEK